MSKRAIFVALFFALSLPRGLEASVVSPLGAIFFYDPLTFDAGVLQRGGSVSQGLFTGGWMLDACADLPLFHELSVRLGYAQRLSSKTPGGHDLTWRIRMPILESARFGRLMSVQIVYSGHHPFAAPDALAPRHEVGGAYSASFARSGLGKTVHTQLGLLVRYGSEVHEPLTLGRVGVAARGAFITQLYRPRFGRGGAWTTTLSVAELSIVHFGVSTRRGGDGRMTLSMAAPAVHFSPRSATYTLGFVPFSSFTYDSAGTRLDWGGRLVLAAFHRSHME